MKKLLPLIIGLLLITSTVLAEDKQWLCVAEHATGYNNENGRWVHKVFPPNSKYLVKYEKPIELPVQMFSGWAVYDYTLDDDFPLCEVESFGQGSTYIKCLANGEFKFHVEKKLFTKIVDYPYFWEKPPYPSIALIMGKCAPL